MNRVRPDGEINFTGMRAADVARFRKCMECRNSVWDNAGIRMCRYYNRACLDIRKECKKYDRSADSEIVL